MPAEQVACPFDVLGHTRYCCPQFATSLRVDAHVVPEAKKPCGKFSEKSRKRAKECSYSAARKTTGPVCAGGYTIGRRNAGFPKCATILWLSNEISPYLSYNHARSRQRASQRKTRCHRTHSRSCRSLSICRLSKMECRWRSIRFRSICYQQSHSCRKGRSSAYSMVQVDVKIIHFKMSLCRDEQLLPSAEGVKPCALNVSFKSQPNESRS